MMIGTLYRCTQQFSIPFITLDGEKDTVTILPGEAVWRLANTGNINGSNQKSLFLNWWQNLITGNRARNSLFCQ